VAQCEEAEQKRRTTLAGVIHKNKRNVVGKSKKSCAALLLSFFIKC